MSTKIGHFEILSELAKSATGTVYKANDPESGQTVALKAIQLSAFGENAGPLQQALLEEAESTKSLSSPNITPIFGAGEIEGQFCVAMEYVQGNSIATMLARKEGFSIWDLLDIGRQVCSGLDKAHAAQVHHYSLEPAKVMCAWDGSIKILSMGASSAGKFVGSMPGDTPSILHYMSPEQVLGDKIDGRSNLFSMGAMFYEMVTDRKAFDGPDADSVHRCILDSTPVAPVQLNQKLHPLLSDLIMKALSKDPAERYQSGRALLDDLENCKESKPQAAKKAAPVAKAPVAAPPRAVVAAKPVAPKPVASKAVSAPPAPTRPAAPVAPRVAPVAKPAEKSVAPAAARSSVAPKRGESVSTPVNAESSTPKAAAAAAGWGAGSPSSSTVPGFDNSIEVSESEPVVSYGSAEQESPYMSSAVAEPPAFEPTETSTPALKFDPMMAEDAPAQAASTSFSEISELPPLKEVVIRPETPPPPPVPAAAPGRTEFSGHVEIDDKPRVNPREVAQKAIKEVKSVPPQLMLYSIAGAVVLILVVTIGLWIHIHNMNGDDDSSSARATTPAAETQPAPEQPAPAPRSAPVTHQAPTAPPAETSEAVEPETPRSAKARNARKKAAAAPVVIPGQMTVDSTPQGAQVRLDGATDPTWVTPLAVSSLDPGSHSITVSKAGYVTDSRTVKVVSGSKAGVIVHLVQLMATLSATSNPPGANIYVDGKDMGKLTPAQVSVDKGQHIVLIRKMGYIDETASAQFALGQTVAMSPTLRPMGNVDNIRTVGKMKKLFGGNGAQPGQGTVSIRTQPKGAQIAVNQHMLEKASPVEIMLDPGNYVIDITMSGYAPVSRVVTVDKGGKAVVDESLQPR
ncbi:MAG TPA: serine/threonine-protein kinase [Candidatus Sulfotelmatobacter sp.]|nr:serine/threonine-protein kinase [Candidatus Sulfotelmatobacter sp.]